ncbi:MAG: capsular polysaccharide synthesis protein [Burkholderiaceae bacterium]|jgi:hypothetical protein|nr:capsular polysaccharide synthesis protein [Burkholderiaceae bacterium]
MSSSGGKLKLQAELALARVLRPWFVHQEQPGPPPAALQSQPWVFGAPQSAVARATPNAIPKIIWAYWDGPDTPLLVQKCVAVWRALHPDFQIHVLDAQTLGDFIAQAQIPQALRGAAASAQKKSDWLRLRLLSQYGGIWLDASIILTQRLDWMLRAQQQWQADCAGFYLQRFTSNPQFPVIENWAMAAPPQSAFIMAAAREFEQHALPEGSASSGYTAHLRALGIYDALRQNIDDPEYLSMHLALQRVLQDPGANYRLALWKAEDTAYWFHQRAGWNRARLKINLLLKKAPDAMPPLIKLRKPDRRKLDDYLRARLYSPESVVGRCLLGAPGQKP